MTSKQALGRGLSALLPGPREAQRVAGAQEVEIGRLVPSRFQPPPRGSEKGHAELADAHPALRLRRVVGRLGRTTAAVPGAGLAVDRDHRRLVVEAVVLVAVRRRDEVGRGVVALGFVHA